MSETEIKLRECPFCGGDSRIVEYINDTPQSFSRKFAVQCEYTGTEKGCGAEGQMNKDKSQAIEAWNTRAEEHHTPTQWAYDQVCKANEKKRVLIESLQKKIEAAKDALNNTEECFACNREALAILESGDEPKDL